MKLTEQKLRQIIREELNEVHPATFQRIRKKLKMKHGLRITDWGKEDMNLQYIEFGTGQRAYVREMSHGNVQVSVGSKEETVSKDRAADKIADFLKITEVRKAIRTILHEAGGAAAVDPATEGSMPKAGQDIHRYLANNGLSTGMDTYEYEGLHFHIDPMGGMAVFVNVFRNRNDSESVVSAKIEGGQVVFQEPSAIKGGRPKRDKVRYTGPQQVVDALVERATGGQTAYR